MAPDPIVFALAVPEPEISPAAARAAGAKVVATGRSDFPNTMDVSLVFPGVFRGLLDSRARNIRLRTLLYAAQALADMVQPDELHADYIVPRIFDFRVAPAIAAAVVRAALEAGEAGRDIAPELVSERTRRFVYEGRLLPPETVRPRRAQDVPRGGDRPAPAARRRAGDPLQDPDPRSPHPEHALRAAGGALAGPRHPRRPGHGRRDHRQGQPGRHRHRRLGGARSRRHRSRRPRCR